MEFCKLPMKLRNQELALLKIQGQVMVFLTPNRLEGAQPIPWLHIPSGFGGWETR